MTPAEPVPEPYARMRWNTPLSEEHAALLLDRLDAAAGTFVARPRVRLGRAAAARRRRRADGRHRSGGRPRRGPARAGTRAGRRAGAGGPGDVRGGRCRGRRRQQPTGCSASASSHALGGTRQMFEALADRVSPGGRVLVGDACWEQPPTAGGARRSSDDEVLPLGEVVELARAAGWRVIHLSTADQREWDDFESTPPPVAARPDSSFSPRRARDLRSCDCRRSPRPR